MQGVDRRPPQLGTKLLKQGRVRGQFHAHRTVQALELPLELGRQQNDPRHLELCLRRHMLSTACSELHRILVDRPHWSPLEFFRERLEMRAGRQPRVIDFYSFQTVHRLHPLPKLRLRNFLAVDGGNERVDLLDRVH